MTEPVDPYPWRPEAVRQLREQGRFEEAEAILNAPLVWQPEEKSLEQWMALGAYLVASTRRAPVPPPSEAPDDPADEP